MEEAAEVLEANMLGGLFIGPTQAPRLSSEFLTCRACRFPNLEIIFLLWIMRLCGLDLL